MSEIEIIRFEEKHKEKWDKFVLTNSVNGTFLQSRIFLDYHKERFVDHSLLFIRGGNTLVAVCPAIERKTANRKEFISHAGSTFGGIVVGKEFYNISNVIEMIDALDNYLKLNGFNYALLKSTNEIFSLENNNLIDYMLYRNNYNAYDELSFAIDFSRLKSDDILLNFKSKTRNLFRSSLKNNLSIKRIESKEEISSFYQILCKSLEKYNTKPVHTLDELYELYYERLPKNIRFYGIFHENIMVAGSMVFIINNVFHTQYLCANPEYLYLKPMDYMDGNLINIAYNEKFAYFSFGISTEDHGKYLNETLAKFKEGFGTQFYINKTFYKEIQNV